MRRVFLVGLVFGAVGGLLLTGCGAPPAASPSSVSVAPAARAETAAVANETDVMFAQMMLAHHEQTLRIVRLAKDRTVRATVRTLIAAIEVTERDEARTLAAWLASWHRPATMDPSAHGERGGAHGTEPGDIDALARAGGVDFEAVLLNTLIAHQHQAVEIARLETASGVNPGARALAERIDQSRMAEVRLMLSYLNSA